MATNLTGLVPQIGQSMNKSLNTIQHRVEDGATRLLNQADEVLSKVANSTGVQFAPVKIPLARRRQTLAVWIVTSMLFICLALNFWAFRYWQGVYFYLYVGYIAWKLVYQTFHRDGGLPIPWLRKCFLWRWFVDFFPVTLHKTVSLDPTKTYIFGYHPHGIIGMGAWAAFASQVAGWDAIFPGIDVRLVTLKLNFFIPFFDLFLTFMGVCDASRESCDAILSSHSSVAIVLGGAKEALDAHPGDVVLFLKDRKGFIKVALTHGASLVPVFGFGENELYFQVSNPKGSIIRQLQEKVQRRIGFAIPIFRGRGIFQYNFGILPRRVPINVVFGEPIDCPKLKPEEIDNDLIDTYHKRYMNALKDLFDAYKEKFNKDSSTLPQLYFR